MMLQGLLILSVIAVAPAPDPVLTEVRELRQEVRACHDAIVKLTAAFEAKRQQIDEDHATVANPTNGLTVRVTKVESSLSRHSWLLYAVAGVCLGIVGQVGRRSVCRLLKLNGKNGNGNTNKK